MKIVRNLTVMAAVAAALTLAAQARADTIDFYLNTNENGNPATSPYVEVIVTLTESNFTTAAAGASAYATVEFVPPSGDIPAPVGINVNGTVTGTSNAGGLGGTGCTDDAGCFNHETGAVSVSTITIDLTLTSGTWADAAAVLIANSDGWEAADNFASTPQDVGKYVAATPLPAALPLFATGLGTMGLLFGWRRKRKSARSLLPLAAA
ncbi:MAG: hypothetical protein ACLP0B_14045 [Steroidobacteraceae bacterium]